MPEMPGVVFAFACKSLRMKIRIKNQGILCQVLHKCYYTAYMNSIFIFLEFTFFFEVIPLKLMNP